MEVNRTKAGSNVAGLISVVIPVYNAARYLRECLASVSAQTYSSIEVIMVNDGSTDDSGEICRQFAAVDSRFRIVDTDNRGVSCARNCGIDLSEGEFICFVDADDTMHPDALSRLHSALISTGSDICVGNYHYGASPAKVPSVPSLPVCFSPHSILEAGLYQKLSVNSPCGTLFRRHIFGDTLRFRKGRRYEDLDLFYKWLLKAGKVAYLTEKLYFYRKHGDSFINTFSPARLDVLDVTDEMLGYIAAECPGLLPAASDRRFSAHYNVWLLLIANGVDMPAVEARCLKVIREERIHEILNPAVRFRNRMGALASFGGKPFVKLLHKFVR